jgi:hypothetical protein
MSYILCYIIVFIGFFVLGLLIGAGIFALLDNFDIDDKLGGMLSDTTFVLLLIGSIIGANIYGKRLHAKYLRYKQSVQNTRTLSDIYYNNLRLEEENRILKLEEENRRLKALQESEK